MKRLIYIIICGLLLFGCDVISEQDRYLSVDVQVGKRRVLLEDFTGWRCVNCPDAAEIAHELQELYGSHVVVIGLHPDDGNWTRPAEGALDLRSEAATAYYTEFGSPTSFPIGMVNRKSYNGEILVDRDKWMTYVNQLLVVDPVADIDIKKDDENPTVDHNLKFKIEVTVADSIDFAVNMQILLLESGLVGPQYTLQGLNKTYTHNHVLRAAINGNFGENVVLPKQGESLIKNYDFFIDEAFIPDNCSVVAYLYRADTNEVLQVVEVSVMNL